MRIAITGATGFVGGRLAEQIVLDGDHEAVGVIRRWSGPGLARLARLPVRLAEADLLDETALRAAFEGCDAVVHTAYGTTGPARDRHRTTVEGAAAVMRAAHAVGARRVVHLSSTVVHGMPANGTIDESTPLAAPATNYDRMKVDAEQAVRAESEGTGTPAVILRPPLIYGPFGRRWTTRILEEIAGGAVLLDGGEGTANFIYVDNLADLTLAAAISSRGDGKAFLAVDPEPVTWREVYEGYRRILPGAPPLGEMSRLEALRALRRREPGPIYRSVILPWRLAPQLAGRALASKEMRRKVRSVPWLDAAARAVPEGTRNRLKKEAAAGAAPESPARDGSVQAAGTRSVRPTLPPSLDRGAIDLLCSRARCDGSLAERTFGHSARISFNEALERIAAWAEYQRIGRAAGNATDGRS